MSRQFTIDTGIIQIKTSNLIQKSKRFQLFHHSRELFRSNQTEIFNAKYMDQDEFYKAFKLFKENTFDPGPQLIQQHILNHSLPNGVRVRF